MEQIVKILSICLLLALTAILLLVFRFGFAGHDFSYFHFNADMEVWAGQESDADGGESADDSKLGSFQR